MTNKELYSKLVDLYAGRELPTEMEAELESEALQDAALSQDMRSLRNTVDVLRAAQSPEFTEESYQRVLMKVYARGVEMQTISPTPAFLQYHLHIQG